MMSLEVVTEYENVPVQVKSKIHSILFSSRNRAGPHKQCIGKYALADRDGNR